MISEVTGLHYNSTVYHVHDGFFYRKHEKRALRMHLRCATSNTCPGRASMPLEPLLWGTYGMRITRDHDHPPQPAWIDVALLRKTILQRCATEVNSPLRTIYDEEIARVDLDVAAELPYPPFQQAMYKARHNAISATLLESSDSYWRGQGRVAIAAAQGCGPVELGRCPPHLYLADDDIKEEPINLLKEESESLYSSNLVPPPQPDRTPVRPIIQASSTSFPRLYKIKRKHQNLAKAVKDLKVVSENINAPEPNLSEQEVFGKHVAKCLEELGASEAALAQQDIQNILTKYRVQMFQKEAEDLGEAKKPRHFDSPLSIASSSATTNSYILSNEINVEQYTTVIDEDSKEEPLKLLVQKSKED